jgi:hypothetical protein
LAARSQGSLLLLHVGFQDVDWGSTTRGSEVRWRPQDAFPVASDQVRPSRSQHAAGHSFERINQGRHRDDFRLQLVRMVSATPIQSGRRTSKGSREKRPQSERLRVQVFTTAIQTIREIGADDLLVAQHGLLRPLGAAELSDGTLPLPLMDRRPFDTEATGSLQQRLFASLATPSLNSSSTGQLVSHPLRTHRPGRGRDSAQTIAMFINRAGSQMTLSFTPPRRFNRRTGVIDEVLRSDAACASSLMRSRASGAAGCERNSPFISSHPVWL